LFFEILQKTLKHLDGDGSTAPKDKPAKSLTKPISPAGGQAPKEVERSRSRQAQSTPQGGAGIETNLGTTY